MAGYQQGYDLNGRDYVDRLDSMTVTRPPENYRWNHNQPGIGMGNDVIEQKYDVVNELRMRRLAWLDQFELEISDEPEVYKKQAYRYWRWLSQECERDSSFVDRNGDKRSVVWWERRPWNDSTPDVAGFWPADK